jgi:hypothetical protein
VEEIEIRDLWKTFGSAKCRAISEENENDSAD